LVKEMTMKYAIVENGVVTNVALADEALESNWVASDIAQKGWTFNGSTFTAPTVVQPTLAEQRAEMSCSRAQGMVVIGATVWAQVIALAEDPDTPWALKVAVYNTYEWRRLSSDMDTLTWAMNLTPEEADALFVAAMAL
jgi:hypothetical protein